MKLESVYKTLFFRDNSIYVKCDRKRDESGVMLALNEWLQDLHVRKSRCWSHKWMEGQHFFGAENCDVNPYSGLAAIVLLLVCQH